MSELVSDRPLVLAPLPFNWKAVPFILIMAAAAGGVCAYFALQTFSIAPTYPDFIVGAISWQAATKFQDLASYPAFLLGFLGCGWALVRLFGEVSRLGGRACEQELLSSLIWWFTPVAIGLGGLFSPYPSSSLFAVAFGLAGSLLTLVLVRVHLKLQELAPAELGLGALSVVLFGLLPYAITTVLDRLPILDFIPRSSNILYISGTLVLVTTYLLVYFARSNATAVSRYISKLLFIAQIGLGLFYLLIVPDLYINETGKLAIPISNSLWLLSIGLILFTVFDVTKRYKRFISLRSADYTDLLSPLAIFSTILLLRNGQTLVPIIPLDDYHFGESLLGWWSFWQYHLLPYVDFFSPHGIFGDDVGGFFSMIFYDGTAATVAEAERLAASMTMLVAFMFMQWCTRSIGLAYISILMFGAIARKLFFLVLVPFFCAWFRYPNNVGPRRWLWWWLISVILLILAVPPQGLLLAVASFPVVVLFIYRARKFQWTLDAIAFSLIGGTLFLFTPLSAMLQGAVRYVIENGPINQIAYGMPLFWSWGGPASDNSKTVTLEFFRMSWILVPIAAAVLILLLIRRRESWGYLTVVVLPTLIFASLMTAYAMGRIDPAAVSRPGLLSNFALTILLPILLAPILENRGKAMLAIIIGFMCAGLGLADVTRGGINDVLVRNKIGNLWSGAEHGLGNMGLGLVEPSHVDRLTRINAFLVAHLKPHEAYLDMTGRNAHYMYFDRPPPIAITAPYNLAPIEQQRREVDRLSKNPPRVVLLDADNMNFDAGGPALRSHLLYRFVLENYRAELHDGYVYGLASTLKGDRSAITFSIKDFTDANWLHGVNRVDAAFIVRDGKTLLHVHPGDSLTLPDGQVRRIGRVWVEGNAIWLDGAAFDPKVFDPSKPLEVRLDPTRGAELSAHLMQQTFAVPDLQKIPLAWGRSSSSLDSAMKPVMKLDMQKAELHDLVLSNQFLKPIGGDPYLWLNLNGQQLTGKSAGILSFSFVCRGQAEARLQLFWWGDDKPGSNVDQSLLMTAANGRIIVPLDAYPSWLQMNHVKGLRIDLDSVGACQSFAISNVSLQQRNNR